MNDEQHKAAKTEPASLDSVAISLAAVNQIVAALAPLEPAERDRVIRTATAFLKPEPTPIPQAFIRPKGAR